MKKKKKILSDHKQIGKRFIPPLLQNGPFLEVKWVDYILPELIWMGFINNLYGFGKGASLALNLSKAASKSSNQPGKWFATTSSYVSLTSQQQNEVLKILTSDDLNLLKTALSPVVTFYPKCPLNFLYKNLPIPTKEKNELNIVKDILSTLFDRGDKEATFIQANAIYIAFVSDLLKVQKDLALANFPAIENFPNTEESRKVASAVRSSINMFMGNENFCKQSFWSNYFWTKGFELESCNFEEINKLYE